MISGSFSLRSQRFFSPFPRGTCSLSVANEYLALRGGPRSFTRDFTYIVLLRNSLGVFEAFGYGPFTLFGAIFHSLHLVPPPAHQGPTTPLDKPVVWALVRFRSPLLTESHSLSFPPLTEMFHFSGCRLLWAILFTQA